ncbi:MAG TPA: hypothetical protein VK483_16985 [Chitinophagaceae bacterium]|nr:hypothetical protein [Chitinophagaceae bacterium]
MKKVTSFTHPGSYGSINDAINHNFLPSGIATIIACCLNSSSGRIAHFIVR